MSIVTPSSNQTSLDQIHEFNQAVSSNSGTVSSEIYSKLRQSCASAVLGMANPVAQNDLVASSLKQLRSKFVNVIGTTSSEIGFQGLSVESLMHALPSGIVILDSYGRIKHSNPAAVQMLGALRQGQYWRELIVEKFEPRVDDGHEVLLKNGLRVNLSTRSLESESGQLIVINDLTETRKLQTQLSRHQRLSSMGKMMSSLAHQIRTPLSAALLHADNLIRRNKQDKAIDDSGRKIISRLRNIERQIRDMLIFAKGETTLTSSVSTTELVEHMHESARDLAAYYGGTLKWRDRSDGAMLNCNLDALIGTFLNLLENAFQASEKNALVTVSVNVEGADSEY
jgi:two-component system sensor histidine kinase FlrB